MSVRLPGQRLSIVLGNFKVSIATTTLNSAHGGRGKPAPLCSPSPSSIQSPYDMETQNLRLHDVSLSHASRLSYHDYMILWPPAKLSTALPLYNRCRKPFNWSETCILVTLILWWTLLVQTVQSSVIFSICNYENRDNGGFSSLEDLGDDDIAQGPHLEVKTCDRFRSKTIISLMETLK